MSLETASIVTAIVSTVIGIAAGLWALYVGLRGYRVGQQLRRNELVLKNQELALRDQELIQRRKDILFPLIAEFDKSKQIDLAKKILDDMIVFAGRRMTVPMETFLNDTSKLKKVFEGKPGFEWVQSSEVVLEENTNTIRINGMPTNHGSPVVSFRIEENMNPQTTETRGFSYDFVASNIGGELRILWYYHKNKLAEILRDHSKHDVTDPGEIAIRSSFDALLDFLGKIGYLLKVGLLKKEEILYFHYYISKIINDVSNAEDGSGDNAIIYYCRIYQFELFAVLLKELNQLPRSLESMIPKI